MALLCSQCGRGSRKGASRSHSHIKTLRRFGINLQWKKIDGARRKICTKCIKTMAKRAQHGMSRMDDGDITDARIPLNL